MIIGLASVFLHCQFGVHSLQMDKQPEKIQKLIQKEEGVTKWERVLQSGRLNGEVCPCCL